MTPERLAIFAEMEATGATAGQIAKRLATSMWQVRRLRQQIAARGLERVVAIERAADSDEGAVSERTRAAQGDAAFQAALRAAIATGRERMPGGEARDT